MHIYSSPDELTSPMFAKAFAAGCHQPLIEDGVYRGGAWAGFGGPYVWESLSQARRRGEDWYYADHGYFHRGTHYRITKNAFQHDGNPGRWRSPGVTLCDWRTDGRHVLVCPPDHKIAALMGFDADAWLTDVLMKLDANTDRPVKVRPRSVTTTRPLCEDLEKAHALVTWTSNAAVDALIYGVPVFCTGDCVASIMGRSDPINIEYPFFPDDRDEWLATLAANQWTLDEIASGIAWSVIK